MTRAEWRKLLCSDVTVPWWPAVGLALKISEPTARQLRNKGELPIRVLKVGAQYRVVSSELAAFLGIDLDSDEPTSPARPALRQVPHAS
jgi:hypothetical protein